MNRTEVNNMLSLQKRMNDNTNGIYWIFGQTKENRDVNWPRCIYGEAFEMMDSFPWKHWKNLDGPIDMENAKIELVDIWHFLMSYGIHASFGFELNLAKRNFKNFATETTVSEDGMQEEKIFCEETYYDLANACGCGRLVENVMESTFKEINEFYENTVEGRLTQFILDHQNGDTYDGLSVYEKIDLLVEVSANASSYEKETFNISGDYFRYSTKMQFFKKMLEIFASILNNDISVDLSKSYICKNTLNEFRQNNGYKDGSYIKTWNNEEDNVHLMRIADEVPKSLLTFEFIYNGLKEIYSSLNKIPAK